MYKVPDFDVLEVLLPDTCHFTVFHWKLRFISSADCVEHLEICILPRLLYSRLQHIDLALPAASLQRMVTVYCCPAVVNIIFFLVIERAIFVITFSLAASGYHIYSLSAVHIGSGDYRCSGNQTMTLGTSGYE